MSRINRLIKTSDAFISHFASTRTKNLKMKSALINRANEKLNNLKGVPSKINQILKMKTHEAVYSEPMDLVDLIDNDQTLTSLIQENSVEKEARAASLGQVHFLNHKSEGSCALKVQYPGASDWLKMDQATMSKTLGVFSQFKNGFNTSEYQKFFHTELTNELDYNREFDFQDKMYQYWKRENPDILIPRPIESSAKWILMERIDSLDLKTFLEMSTAKQRKSAQKLIVEFYLKSILLKNYVHADPNLGNFGFQLMPDSAKLVVYDFGSIVEVSESQRLAFLHLIQQLLSNQEDLFPILEELGFDVTLISSLRPRAFRLFEILFAPFLSPGQFDLKAWNRKSKVKDLLGDYRFTFMSSAPIELFAWMRAFHGLFFYAEALDSYVFAKSTVEQCLKLESSKLSRNEINWKNKVQVLDISKTLKIMVYEDSKVKVKLEFPLKAIDSLEDLLPENAKAYLTRNHIDLEDIQKNLRKNNYPKGAIFDLDLDLKKVVVSII